MRKSEFIAFGNQVLMRGFNPPSMCNPYGNCKSSVKDSSKESPDPAFIIVIVPTEVIFPVNFVLVIYIASRG